MSEGGDDRDLLLASKKSQGHEQRSKFFRFIKKAKQSTLQTSLEIEHMAASYRDFFFKWNDGVLPTISLYIIWITVGTLFYANYDFNNYAKGFYFAINVGYSIGWGTLKETHINSKLFSTFYLLVGAIFVSRWLAHIIAHAIRDSDDAYEQMLIRKRIRAETRLRGVWADLYIFVVMNNPKLFCIYLWLVYITFGTSFSICALKWTLTEGLYYAISSMSTGGLQHVPEESPDWVFLVTGLFAASGVPVMGMAISNIGYFIFSARRASELEGMGSVDISADDFDLLKALRDGKGGANQLAVNKMEFIILSLAKRGVLDWRELQSIVGRFEELDEQQVGHVTFKVRSTLHQQEGELFEGLEKEKEAEGGVEFIGGNTQEGEEGDGFLISEDEGEGDIEMR